jgi:arthrofactin-type cyclic lipopeptide synthetase C
MPEVLHANARGTRDPLVFVHTWPIEARYFDALAGHVGGDQPLFALPCPPPDVCARFNLVADWVEYELEQLSELPVEAFRLAGWSFGGVVALELARRIAPDGVRVTSVDLVDTWIPRGHPRSVAESAAHHLQRILALAPSARRAEIAAVARRVPRQVQQIVKQKSQEAARRFGRGAPPPRHKVDPQSRAIWVPFVKYQPAPYFGRVTVSACEASIRRNDGDPSLGWSRWLVEGFATARIEGDHRSMWTEPHIKSIAQVLCERGA